MTAVRPRSAVAAVLVVLLFVLSLPLFSTTARGGTAAPPSVGPLASHLLPAQVLRPLGPHPLTVLCPPMYPMWGAIGSFIAPSPAQKSQAPCPWTGQDEMHTTFYSNHAGSGSNFTLPLYLPKDPNNNQANSYAQLSVGMVVAGDIHTEWKQSYLELLFTPSGSGASLTYSEGLAVFSLVNLSYWGSSGCPGGGIPGSINFTWNNSYFCEIDDLGSGNGLTGLASIPAGSWLNITFAGSVGGSTGLRIWSNDSTTKLDSYNTTLNKSNDGTGPAGSFGFEPAFDTSCVDRCILKWGMGFGLGIGVTPCPNGPAPFAPCDSYNQYTWISNPPLTFGHPEYRVGSTYNGDYLYFSPESASGGCNGLASPGQLTTCFENTQNGGTGYYPIFTYNGTFLNFGTNYSWTTEDFGSSLGNQYYSDGAPHDILPFWLDQVTNNSLAGFAAPASPVNVSVRLQDLGNTTGARLHYQISGGAWNILPMPRISGTNSSGIYNATIPAGPNGLINFTVSGTNSAGASLNSTYAHVERGPLPTFKVTFSTNPAACGKIYFNGSTYRTNDSAMVKPGFYQLQGSPCYPSAFFGWNVTRGVSLAPERALGPQFAIAAVSANVSIQGVWKYVRPHDLIVVDTNPGICGSVDLNGTVYTNNSPVLLLDALAYTLKVQSACALKVFAGWTFTGGNFSILGNSITPTGNGTLTANFILASLADPIVFYTAPTSCGGVLYRGAGYPNGANLSVLAGTYPIAGDPCPHFGLRNFSTSGGLSVSGFNLTVSGSGWIRETNYHLTEVHIVTNPAFCGSIEVKGVNYTNGQVVVVANNSTFPVYAFACAGYSLLSLTANGGLHLFGNLLTANGSGQLTAVFQRGAARSFVAFQTDPINCGTIFFEGVSYHDSGFTNVAPFTVATLSALSCPNYGFVRWVTSGDITVVGGTAYVNGSSGGSIQAIFRPLAPVFLYTQPYNCGSITLGGVVYQNNATVLLPIDNFYSLSAQPCANHQLSGWINSTSTVIVGSQLFLLAGAQLTAVFTPIQYRVLVTIDPANCGQVRVGGQAASNGSVLSLVTGSYPLTPVTCLGDSVQRWSTSGSLNVSGLGRATLFVNGSGTLGATYRPVAPSVTLSVQSSAFVDQGVPFVAVVAVPVPPYNYNFTWNFGDGTVVTTPANFTSHTYGSAGTYQVSVEVKDPYGRTANSTSSITILSGSARASATSLPPILWVGIGLIALFLVAIVVGTRLARRTPKPEEGTFVPERPGGPAESSLPEETDNIPPPDPKP